MYNIEIFSFSVQIQNYHNHLLFKVDVKVFLLAEKFEVLEKALRVLGGIYNFC